MKWANAIHQILNYIGVAIGVIETILVTAGCTNLGGGMLDCSSSFIPPQYAMIILAFIFAIKQAINVVRDGWGSVIKVQPPIK